MQFGAPIFFYALAGIAIPVIIHLWSKNTRQSVAFGSLQFLHETATKTTNQLWPSELLLLILRALTIAALVLIFVTPFIYLPVQYRPAHLIDPNIAPSERKKIFDSLPIDEPVYWLSPHHRLITSQAPHAHVELWTSIESFDEYTHLTIYTLADLTNFEHRIEPPNQKINWVIIPKTPIRQKSTVAKGDQTTALELMANDSMMIFNYVPTSTTGQEKKLTVWIQSDDSHSALAQYIRAALSAIDQSSLVTIEVSQLSDSSALDKKDWLVWLIDEAPKLRENLIYIGATTDLLKEEYSHVYRLNKDITVQDMLERNFPLRLETALTKSLNDEFNLYDQRTIPTHYLSSGSAQQKTKTIKHSWVHWSWSIFLILLCSERWVAIRTAKR